MMCERRDLAIAKLAGGDLSGWRAARLRRHLDTCRRCASMHAELSAQQTQSREAYFAADQSSLGSVSNAVLSAVDLGKPYSERQRVRIRLAGGAVLAALLVGAVTLQLPSSLPSKSESPLAKAPVDIGPVPPIEVAPVDHAATTHSDVVIRMLTNNPDVVIYWLGDTTGGS